jgi:mannose-1-phosphate guanylyltransferase
VIHSVIMVGGSGTRLWPASRAKNPKQMMKVAGDESLLGGTMRRARELAGDSVILVATSQLADPMRKELPGLARDALIIEPEGRDTAACVGLAAVHVAARDPDGVMLVMPADHVVGPIDKFFTVAETAVHVADRERCLVSIGIVPRSPATGYGYVHRGDKIQGDFNAPAYTVKQFREKPDRATAQQYVDSGEYYWNSGIFAWRADVILKEIETHLPEHHARLRTIAESLDSAEVINKVYSEIPRISVDYGILEKAQKVAVVEADFDWDDVGCWSALAGHYEADDEGNAVKGQFLGIDSHNCIVDAQSGKLVVGVGIDDLVIVDTPDVLMVIPRSRDQEVKKAVEKLKALGKGKYL